MTTFNAHHDKAEAVRTIYFDGQRPRATVTSFKRIVRALKTIGMKDDQAKVAVLTIFDYASRELVNRLLEKGVVTPDQVERSDY